MARSVGLLNTEYMRLRFQYLRYRLAFRTAVRTAHGLWTEREGLLVRLTDEAGRVGLGEAACLPWFGTERVESALAAAGKLGEWVESECLADVPLNLVCLRNALAAAQGGLGQPP